MLERNERSFIKVGCSGFAYSAWRGNFYAWETPFEKMLESYAARFRTVEINGSYYGYLHPDTLKSWEERVPEDFLFSFKVPAQLIRTSCERERSQGWGDLARMIDPLIERDHLGALLFQIPASQEEDPDLLESLAANPFKGAGDMVFEFKHPSWNQERTMDRLRAHGADYACVSRPGEQSVTDLLGPHKYFRLNGEKREGSSDYAFKDLQEWGRRILEIKEQVSRVYVYFNNTQKGCAPINARALIQHVLKQH